ncbi:MAG: DUF4118 domain-containing protein [Planctomycetes bacterium]|nr:DUF4118 domain-containing protein [Planctomycetota bacterium]
MNNRSQVIILILISLLCVLGHLFSPPEWGFAHQFLFKLTYLPIVLAAIWVGRWFALQLTTLFCLVYVFHIFIQLYHHSHHNISSTLLDLGLYFVVAWVTGVLSDRQKENALRLSEAYSALKEKTAILLEFEDNARKTERLKTMGELAGTVAHEVRTPLSALQGAVEIVISDKTDEATRKKFSKTVFREVQRINQVVGEFLKLGNEKKIQTEGVLLKDFIMESMTLLIPVLKKKNIEFELDIPENQSATVQTDPFKQVLMNLVINSSNAIPPEGGKIHLSTITDGTEVHIFVQDNGTGVPDHIRKQLFEPFVTGRKEGSGLGLYLSRNIIRSFGGELELLKSEPGCTEFIIKLPGDA